MGASFSVFIYDILSDSFRDFVSLFDGWTDQGFKVVATRPLNTPKIYILIIITLKNLW